MKFINKRDKRGVGQVQWTISLILIALFAIAIIGFMIGFANDNNAAINIGTDQQINLFNQNLNQNVSNFSTGGSQTYASIVNSTITSGFTTQSGAPFTITPLNIIGVTISIMTFGFQKIFGQSSAFNIFLMTFIGTVIFITAMLIWKTWAGREPN